VAEPTEAARALTVVRSLFAELFSIDVLLEPDTLLADIGIDSLEVVDALIELQERIIDELGDDADLSLPTTGVTLVRVGDLVDTLVDLGWLRSPQLVAVLERSS
jgi:acyl carrier protein